MIKSSMNPFLPDDKFLNQFKKSVREGLRKIFGSKITNNFLFEMMDQVQRTFGPEIFNYFDFQMNDITMLQGNSDSRVEYEIARNIVGIHRFNVALLDDKTRADMEKNPEYRNKLCDEIISQIKIRRYASYFFRTNKINQGEEFLYYPLAYKLFALATKGYEVYDQRKQRFKEEFLLTEILNKSLSALTLLENNFLDSAYAMCRTAIENFVRMLVIVVNPNLIDEYSKFVMFDVKRNQCNGVDSNELKEAEKNAKYRGTTVDFIHFGWTDKIDDYKPKNKPYSIQGLMDYIENKYENSIKDMIPLLRNLYKQCHTYAHGTIGQTVYPILHYQEVTSILFLVLTQTVDYMCNIYNADKTLNGINVFELLNKDFDDLSFKRQLFTTENLNKYYKIKN